MRKTRLVEFGGRVASRMHDLKIDTHTLCKQIEASYEMTRRYARGIALPQTPEAMQRLAKALKCSVGWLLAEESSAVQLPLRELQSLNEPIQSAIRVAVEDQSMLMQIDSYAIFSPGDEVLLYPRKAMPGDVVAIRSSSGVTLRKYTESDSGPIYKPSQAAYQNITKGAVLGVIAKAQIKLSRA